MGDELDGMSDVAGELEQQRQHLEEAQKLTVLLVLENLSNLRDQLPGANEAKVDPARVVRKAYTNSMRVVSQTMLGVEPEVALAADIIDPLHTLNTPPDEATKTKLRSLVKTMGAAAYGVPHWINTMPQITAMESRRDALLKRGVSKEAIEALMNVAKALGICTMNAPMRWFFSLTSHVIREILWIQQGIDIPEEMTDNEGP